MRHKKSGRKLGRNPSHRKALFRNLAKALLTHGRITTTEAKAKDLRGVVEPLITLALKNDLHARREAYRFLGEHKLVARLFNEIGPQYAGGGGGYTRVVKLAVPRKGDAAPLAVIELVKRSGEAAEKKPVPLKMAPPVMPAKAPEAAATEKAAEATEAVAEAPVTETAEAAVTETAAEAAETPAAETAAAAAVAPEANKE